MGMFVIITEILNDAVFHGNTESTFPHRLQRAALVFSTVALEQVFLERLQI
jgi:hypothetical protein